MKNKPKIPEHLRKVLANEHLTETEKAAMTKPLSMEDKKNATKALKKIGIANDLWNDDWTDLQSRLPTMDYKEQHRELSRLLTLIRAHKNAYQLKGVDKVNGAETEITYTINDIEHEHPELKPPVLNLNFTQQTVNQNEYKIVNNISTDNRTIINANGQSKQKVGKTDRKDAPQTLKEIFIKPYYCEHCLKALQQIGAINANNEYIWNNKGVFPLWIKELETNGFIHKQTNDIYKNLLNAAIKNLNLSKDASEFTKTYKRLENSDIPDDLRYYLSQIKK